MSDWAEEKAKIIVKSASEGQGTYDSDILEGSFAQALREAAMASESYRQACEEVQKMGQIVGSLTSDWAEEKAQKWYIQVTGTGPVLTYAERDEVAKLAKDLREAHDAGIEKAARLFEEGELYNGQVFKTDTDSVEFTFRVMAIISETIRNLKPAPKQLAEFRKVGEVSAPGGTTETYSRQAHNPTETHSLSPSVWCDACRGSCFRESRVTARSSDDDCADHGIERSRCGCAGLSSDEYEVTVVNPGKARPLYRHEQVAPLVAAANAWLDVGASLSFSSPQFKALRAAVAPFNSKESKA
jgi:hypothetical protein